MGYRLLNNTTKLPSSCIGQKTRKALCVAGSGGGKLYLGMDADGSWSIAFKLPEGTGATSTAPDGWTDPNDIRPIINRIDGIIRLRGGNIKGSREGDTLTIRNIRADDVRLVADPLLAFMGETKNNYSKSSFAAITDYVEAGQALRNDISARQTMSPLARIFNSAPNEDTFRFNYGAATNRKEANRFMDHLLGKKPSLLKKTFGVIANAVGNVLGVDPLVIATLTGKNGPSCS